MEQKQKLAIINKDKEPIKRRITRGMVSVTHGNIVEQKKEAVCNSIGPDVRNGFHGAIGKSIVSECGEAIIDECYEETKKVYGTDGIMKEGQFVTTSAGNSDTFKNVIHCVCPSSVDENADEILTNLVYQVLMFCNKSMVDSFATPPMSSGILGFTFERCARCFFTAIMNFLEDIDHKTTLKSLSFVIYEKEKAEEFQDIWEELMIERFGSLESEEESDDEPLPADNRMVAQPPKDEKKSTGQIKTNKNYNSSSDEEEKKTEKKSKKRAPRKKIIKKIITDSDTSSDDGGRTVSHKKLKKGLQKSKPSDLQSNATSKALKKRSLKSRKFASSSDDSSSDSESRKIKKSKVGISKVTKSKAASRRIYDSSGDSDSD